jgi:hypothetical protein
MALAQAAEGVPEPMLRELAAATAAFVEDTAAG